jgi:hypothetical protein
MTFTARSSSASGRSYRVWDRIRNHAGIVVQLLAVAETERARGVEAFLATIVERGPP